MTGLQDLLPSLLSVLGALAISTVFLLALFVGFCIVFGFPKLRPGGGRTLVVRSLDEALGSHEAYLPPDAPRGPADQLHSPELLEAAARKTA